MEQMIPELEDLEERGFFSKAEIKHIVKKREQFEYLLKRPAPVKGDFYRYVQYEQKLEELRLHRKEALGLHGKKSLADSAIVQRCHFIFDRACRRFKGDLRLWLRWLQFCRDSNSPRQMSRVLTRALQLHVSEPGLWSYAAAWEFDHNGNAAAARMLMQRGLRMRPDSQQLWLEYFKLELHYAQKLVARRKVLGIDSPAPAQPTAAVTAAAQQQAAVVGEGGSEAMSMDGATAEQQPDTQAAVAADQDAAAEQLAAVQQQGVLEMDARQDPAAVSELISGSQPGSEGPSLASAGPGPSAADEAVQAVLGGAIAKVVFVNAIAALPGSLDFRAGLLRALRPFHSRLSGAPGIWQAILASIAHDFADSERAHDLLAREAAWAAEPDTALQAAQKVYHVALQRCSGSAAMHELYAVFLQQHAEALTIQLTKLEQQQQAARAAGKTGAAKQQRKQLRARKKGVKRQLAEAVTLLEAACSGAAQQGCASEQVLLAWPAAALRARRAQAALQAARSACQALPASAGVWEQRLKLEGQRLSLQVDQATHSSVPAPATPDALPVSTATGSSDDDESGSIAEASPAAAARSAAVEEFAGLAQQALTAVPPSASHSLWLLALQFTGQLGDPGVAGSRSVDSALKCLLQLLETTAAAQGKGPLRGGFGQVAAAAFEQLHCHFGLTEARALVDRLLKVPSPGGSFWHAVLLAELEETKSVGALSDVKRTKRLFEAAVSAHGSEDAELWLLYAHCLHSQHKMTDDIFWRANKALQDPTAFTSKYHLSFEA